MSSLLAPTLDQYLVFIFVLTRISGLVMTLPAFGSRTIPIRVRAMLAIGISVLITPLHWTTPVGGPGNLLNLAVMLGREAVLGLAMGLGILILFAGLQLSGLIIGQMSGMQLADAINPNTDTTVPVFSQFLDMMTLAVFLTIGGHRQVIAALLDTFQWMPPGHVQIGPNLFAALSDVMTQSFMLGIRAAAPVIIALLLSVLIMGLISRTLPQLNVIAVGFSFNSMVMLATLSISLGTVAWIFQEQTQVAIDIVSDAIMPDSE